MPKVPQYQESQRFGNAPDARFSVDGRALSSALGGETWGAVAHAGRQMRAAGGQLGGIALDMMRQHNETVAMDRLNKAEAAILDMQTEQSKRLGENALDSEDGKRIGVSGTLRAGLDKLRGELTQNMNPAQQKLFGDVFARRGQSVLRWGAGFEAQQREIYTASVEDGKLAVEGLRAMAHYGDREQVEAALGNALFVVARRGKRLGLAPEAVEAQRAETAQKLLLPVFDAMLARGELGQARQYAQNFGGILGAGTVAAVRAKIDARAEALRARAEAARKKAEAAWLDRMSAAVWKDTAGLPWERRRETALHMIAARTEDPEERRALLDAFDSNAEFQKVEEKAQQSRKVRELVEDARAQKLRPTEFLQRLHDDPALSEEDSALAWEKFQGKIEETPLNRLALADLKREMDRRRRNGNPVSEAEIEAWGLDNRATDAQIKAAHEYDGKASGVAISELESLWKKAGGGKAPDDLHAIVVDMLEDGKKPTKEDLEKIVRNLAWEGEIQGGGVGWGRDRNFYQALGTEREGSWLPDEDAITRQEKEHGEAFLTAKKWPVTSLTLRVYAKVARGIPHSGIASLAEWPEFSTVQPAQRENAPGAVPKPSPSVAAVAPKSFAASSVPQATVVAAKTEGERRREQELARRREARTRQEARARQAQAEEDAATAERARSRRGGEPLPLPDAVRELPENAGPMRHDYVVTFGELPPAGMSETDMKKAIQDRIEEDLDSSVFSGAYARQQRALRVEYLKRHLQSDIRHPVTGKSPKDWK